MISCELNETINQYEPVLTSMNQYEPVLCYPVLTRINQNYPVLVLTSMNRTINQYETALTMKNCLIYPVLTIIKTIINWLVVWNMFYFPIY